jgi:hypothetical protein
LLGERLRREATDSRPAFSESLHQRILTAVRRHHAAEAGTADRPVVSRRRGRGLAAALAAACVLCAAAIGWQLMKQPGTVETVQPVAKASIADLPSIDDLTGQAVVGLDRLAVSVAFEPQATHLKHDARSVANVFLDRLPVDVKLVDNR